VLNGAFLILLTALFTFSSVAPAEARKKKIRGSDGLIALSLCRAAADVDNNPRDQDNVDPDGTNCCSKELGYCIECLNATPSFCTKYPYSKRPDFGAKGTLQQPADQVIAPVDNTPKLPTAKGTLHNAPATQLSD
jgi:hypothetical protein